MDAETHANIRGTRRAGYQAITEYLSTVRHPWYGKTVADKATKGAAAVDRRANRGR